MKSQPHPPDRRLLRALVLALSLPVAGLSWGQMRLPQWSDEEWERLQTEPPELGGALFPGTDYLPEANPVEESVVPEEVPHTPEVVSLGPVSDLPEELVSHYFPEKLVERVLDPQSLLTQARLDGIENFLDYHFREARSAIHILVLRPTQRLPSDLRLREIHHNWFGDRLAVLVVYNFGNPEMSRLIFGAEAERRISEAHRINACFEAIDEAMVVANAEDQLERFLMELSRRLYWIEDQFHGVLPQDDAVKSAQSGKTQRGVPPEPGLSTKVLWLTILSITTVLIMVGAGIAALQRRAANKTYFFPERRCHPRLGCPRGGGNRLVVSFGEANTRPKGPDLVNGAIDSR